MIGLLFIFVILLAVFIEKRRKEKDENYSKANPADVHGEKSYYDSNGMQHLFGSNAKVHYDTDPYTLDLKSYDGDSRKEIRNFDAEDRELQNADALRTAIKNGEKYYRYRMEGDKNSHFYDNVRGARYKNIENGKICVIRMVPNFICNGNGSSFFMDIETGMYEDAIYHNQKYKTSQNIKKDKEVKEKFNEWRATTKEKGKLDNIMNW